MSEVFAGARRYFAIKLGPNFRHWRGVFRAWVSSRIETTSEAGKNFADLSFWIDQTRMKTLLEGVVL